MFAQTLVIGRHREVNDKGAKLSLLILEGPSKELSLSVTLEDPNGWRHCHATKNVAPTRLGELQRYGIALEKAIRRGGAQEALQALDDIAACCDMASRTRSRISTASTQEADRASRVRAILETPLIYGHLPTLKDSGSFIIHERNAGSEGRGSFSLQFPLPHSSKKQWTGDCATFASFFLSSLRKAFPGENFDFLEYRIRTSLVTDGYLSHYQVRDPKSGTIFDGSRFFGELVKGQTPHRIVELNPAVNLGPPMELAIGNKTIWLGEFEKGHSCWCTAATIAPLSLPELKTELRPGEFLLKVSIEAFEAVGGRIVRCVEMPMPVKYSTTTALPRPSLREVYENVAKALVEQSPTDGLPRTGPITEVGDLIPHFAESLHAVWSALCRGQMVNGKVPVAAIELMKSKLAVLNNSTTRWWE